MSNILFLALAILNSGTYDSRPASVDFFNYEMTHDEYHVVGELHGVRVSCTDDRKKCFASNGVAIELLTKE